MEVYFGRRWDAPAFDDATEIPAPVGQLCLYCDEPIAEGDSGTTMGYVGALGSGVRAVHLECFLRSALGDVPHLEGRCSCAGGGEHDLRPYREASKATLQWLLENRRGKFVE